ncbi:MAG: hypothetical protein ACRBI6_04520 [Acidimicrobiales bacterium]
MPPQKYDLSSLGVPAPKPTAAAPKYDLSSLGVPAPTSDTAPAQPKYDLSSLGVPNPEPASSPDLEVFLRKLPTAAKTAGEGAAVADYVQKRFSPAVEQTQDRLQHKTAVDVLMKAAGLEYRAKAANKAAANVPALAEPAGDKEMGALTRQIVGEERKEEPGLVRSALSKGLTFLDTPGRVTRHMLNAAVDPEIDLHPLDATLARGDLGDTKKTFKTLKKNADKAVTPGMGTEELLGHMLASEVRGFSKPIGQALQIPGAHLGGALAANWDVLGKTARDPANFVQHVKDGAKLYADGFGDKEATENVEENLLAIGLDPLNLVGMGSTAGGAKAALGQGQRIAKAAGLSDDAARALAKDVQALSGSYGEMSLATKLDDVLKTHGVAPEVAERVLGRGGEFLGKAGGTALSKLSAGKLPEQLGRRGIEKARTALGGELNANERLALKSAGRESRFAAQAGTQRQLTDWNETVAPLTPTKADGSINAERVEELVRRVVDPDVGGDVIIPTEPELKWLDAMDDFFKKNEAALEAAGHSVAKNKISGRYFPRQYGADASLGGLQRRIKDFDLARSMGLKPDHRPGNAASPFKKRRTDRPLGRDLDRGLKASFDPNDVVTKYVPKVERSLQQAKYEAWVGDNFATQVDDLHHIAADEAFPTVMNSAGEAVRVPKKVKEALDGQFNSMRKSGILDKAISWFKETVTIPVARYHIVNWGGDLTMMYAAGYRSPETFKIGAKALDSATDGGKTAFKTPMESISFNRLRGELETHGIAVDPGGGHLDLDTMRGPGKMKAQFDDTAMKAAGASKGKRLKNFAKNNKAEVAKAVLTQGRNVGGRKLATWWDHNSKAAFYIERRMRGDSPRLAAQRTYEALYDYGDQSALLRGVKKLVPFANYQAKALTNIPKVVAKAPAMPLNIQRGGEMLFGGGEHEDASPAWQSEMGTTMQLGKPWRNAVQAGARAMTGEKLDPGLGMSFRLREPITELYAQMGEAIPQFAGGSGNIDPLAMSMGPHIQAGREWLTEQDAMTKRPLEAPELPRMFANGMPGIPEALQARDGQVAPVTRYLPQAAVPSDVLTLLNAAMGAQYLGRHRDRSSNEAQANALRLLNQLTALNVATTTPMTDLVNQGYAKPLQRTSRLADDLKRDLEKALRNSQ